MLLGFERRSLLNVAMIERAVAIEVHETGAVPERHGPFVLVTHSLTITTTITIS